MVLNADDGTWRRCVGTSGERTKVAIERSEKGLPHLYSEVFNALLTSLELPVNGGQSSGVTSTGTYIAGIATHAMSRGDVRPATFRHICTFHHANPSRSTAGATESVIVPADCETLGRHSCIDLTHSPNKQEALPKD